MIVAMQLGWTAIIVHAIIGAPAIIAAIYAGRIHSKVTTPSGKSIGKQVEDVNHTTLSNHQHLGAISDKIGAENQSQGETV